MRLFKKFRGIPTYKPTKESRSKKILIREWLALLIIVPFSIGYLSLFLKALFLITTSQELSQVAATLLYPIPLVTLFTLILGHYFRHHRNDNDSQDR